MYFKPSQTGSVVEKCVHIPTLSEMIQDFSAAVMLNTKEDDSELALIHN